MEPLAPSGLANLMDRETPLVDWEPPPSPPPALLARQIEQIARIDRQMDGSVWRKGAGDVVGCSGWSWKLLAFGASSYIGWNSFVRDQMLSHVWPH